MKKVLMLKKIYNRVKLIIMKNIFKIFGFVGLGLIITSGIQAQDWNITSEQKATQLQIPFTGTNQEAGEILYNKNCKMCHSTIKVVPKNDRVLPIAPNLGCQVIQSTNTDGELFWKITNGKGGMPPYANSLSDDERWKLVVFLRMYFNSYAAPTIGGVAPEAPGQKFQGTIKSMKLSFDDKTNKISAKLTAVDAEGNPTIPKNIKVKIYVKRYFGNLLLGTVKTNDAGVSSVECPKDIPADTGGYIFISATTADSSATAIEQVKFGQKLVWDNPNNHPTLWGTSKRSPLWLKASYISMVLAAWAVIFWAFFQLYKIRSIKEN